MEKLQTLDTLPAQLDSFQSKLQAIFSQFCDSYRADLRASVNQILELFHQRYNHEVPEDGAVRRSSIGAATNGIVLDFPSTDLGSKLGEFGVSSKIEESNDAITKCLDIGLMLESPSMANSSGLLPSSCSLTIRAGDNSEEPTKKESSFDDQKSEISWSTVRFFPTIVGSYSKPRVKMKKSHAVFKPMSFKHRARPTFCGNRYKVDDDAIEYLWGREYNRVVDPNKSRILPILVVRDSSGSMRTPAGAVNGSPNCVGQGLSMELLASNKSEGLQPAPKGRRVRNQQSVEGNDYQSFLVIELISSKGGNIITEPSSKYQGSQEMCEKSILNGFGMHHLVEVVGVSQKKFEEVRPRVKMKNLESVTWTGEGKEISQEYKMGCFVAGLRSLHKSTSLETSTYMEGWTEFVQIVQNYFFSYFLVNARLETSLRWELVLYKNDGDDTYDGLGLLLLKCTELGDLIVLSQRGNKRAIGLFVGNIYGILDDNQSGLLMPTNALSFDEAAMEKEKVEEDYALSLGDLQHEAEQVHERPIRDVYEKLALMKTSVLERPATSTVMGDSQLLQRWDCCSLCCCNSAFAPKFFFGTFS